MNFKKTHVSAEIPTIGRLIHAGTNSLQTEVSTQW